MKILISYFYQIRFFPKNFVPISTAAFDPKWFHPWDNKKGPYLHKSGIVYGLRMEEFSPLQIDCDCKKNCEHDPKTCKFLKDYKNWLDTRVDFEGCKQKIYKLATQYNQSEKEPIAVLIVYETPDNPCSERSKLIQWFKEHNYQLEEFDKNKL